MLSLFKKTRSALSKGGDTTIRGGRGCKVGLTLIGRIRLAEHLHCSKHRRDRGNKKFKWIVNGNLNPTDGKSG